MHDQSGDAIAAVRQVAELVSKATGHNVQVATDGASFRTVDAPAKPRPGILAIEGRFDAATSAIRVDCVLLRAHPQQRLPVALCFGFASRWLAEPGDRARLLPPETQRDGMLHVGVALQVQASPLSLVRADRLAGQLGELQKLAVEAQAELPAPDADAALASQYAKLADHLRPILPLDRDLEAEAAAFAPWANDCGELLAAGCPIALCAPSDSEQALALASIAAAVRPRHASLGMLQPPAVNARAILDLARSAPGVLVIPALSLQLGTSPYEMGHEMRGLLTKLQADRCRAMFCGRWEELQTVLSGGQGARQDPLSPAVCHSPEFPLPLLARHTARATARAAGGLSPADEARVAEAAFDSLASLPPPEQRRLLMPTIAKLVADCLASGAPSRCQPELVRRLHGRSETLGGLVTAAPGGRPAAVQQNLARLGEPAFRELLLSQLSGQELAVAGLCERLRTEALTRPARQPLRYCAQGTPGTGKTASAQLIADYLGIPYVNIDAASMSDPHTAASQLLGAGRGIVSSYRAGRIEQAARHHAGVVLEVSDLDHAPPPVRSALADLFLQVLDQGVVQSAVGDSIPCANLIVVFTVNLPAGRDERLRSTLGFTGELTRREITARVSAELKDFTSSAFLSRVGTPIVFDPLGSTALAAIEERAVRTAVATAAERLGLGCCPVDLEPGLGARLLSLFGDDAKAVGARAVIEHGCAMAAAAVAGLAQGDRGATLAVCLGSEGKLVVTQRN